jgi:hypothetical protein
MKYKHRYIEPNKYLIELWDDVRDNVVAVKSSDNPSYIEWCKDNTPEAFTNSPYLDKDNNFQYNQAYYDMLDVQAQQEIINLDIQKRAKYAELCDPITNEIERKENLSILGVYEYTDEERTYDLQLLYSKTLEVQSFFSTKTKSFKNVSNTIELKGITSVKSKLYDIDAFNKKIVLGLVLSTISIIGLGILIFLNLC